MPPFHVTGAFKELNILRIRARPAAFDEGHAEFIQSLRHADLVIARKREAFRLGTIAECGVVDLDLLHSRPYVIVRRGAFPTKQSPDNLEIASGKERPRNDTLI